MSAPGFAPDLDEDSDRELFDQRLYEIEDEKRQASAAYWASYRRRCKSSGRKPALATSFERGCLRSKLARQIAAYYSHPANQHKPVTVASTPWSDKPSRSRL